MELASWSGTHLFQISVPEDSKAETSVESHLCGKERPKVGAPTCVLLQGDDASLDSCRGSFGAVFHVEFFQHMADVQLHRYFGDVQGVGNFLVAPTFGDHAEDFEFATGEGAVGETFGEVGGDDRVEMPLAGMDIANGAQEVFTHDALEHVTMGSSLHGTIDFLFAGVGGEHEHTGIGMFANDGGSSFCATHAGQANVHDDEVRTVTLVGVDGGLTVGSFGYDFHVGLGIERCGQAHSNHEMVVNHQNTYGFCVLRQAPPGD